jgi:indolepyruvate ferredoxin oxidoreductase beta subunit
VLPILERHHPAVHRAIRQPIEADGHQAPPRGATIGAAAALRHLRRVATEVDEQMRAAAPAGEASRAIVVDGRRTTAEVGQYVMLETWDASAFERDGIAALRQAARDDRVGIFMVYAGDAERGQDLARLVRAAIPADRADRVVIDTANVVDGEELHERCRAAAHGRGLTVIVVEDGPPPRFDVGAIERSFADIDRLGFEPLQKVVWSLDRACAVRQPVEDEGPDPDAGQDHPAMRTELRVTAREGADDQAPRLRARPLLEQVEVLRTRPPVQGWRRDAAARLPLPEILHRQAGRWRMHVAGLRGDGPGLVGRILCRAGVRMGYAVRIEYDDTPIGPGRRAWAQLLFTRPRATEVMPPFTARIPAGEADVVLGLDAAETVRALADDGTLQVASTGHTYVVANTGFLTDETETEGATLLREQLRVLTSRHAHAHPRLLEDFAEACRMGFHTDRIADLAILGAAFQIGLVPVTVDTLEESVAELEPGRYGRLLEAFRFGRHLALERPLFTRPKDDRSEDVSRIVRRASHLLSRGRWGGAANHERAVQLLRTSVEAMPGLMETEPGRTARRDFVIALNRCRLWGGLEYAEQYARLITTLYRADRADSARSLTRNAILPLAGAMLIRDLMYVASVATSAEHRRRLRQRLNIKRARADRVERRYLTRLELQAFGKEIRADVRTSDWPARLVTAARPVVPRRWRGSSRERDLRETVIELVEKATHDAPSAYERHVATFARLHAEAVENRLRLMEPAEVRALVDDDASLEAEPEIAAET